MSTSSTSAPKRDIWSVARRRSVIALLLGGLGAAAAACGGSELDPDAPPLLTIDECTEVGGAPLFDPEDGRPVESSCPEGLGFLGVFDEPFFGSDGGICCGAPDAPASDDDEAPGGASHDGTAADDASAPERAP